MGGTATESFVYTNVATTQGPFTLKGGKYMVSVVAANFGTIKLQRQGADGSTFLDIKQPFDNAGTEQDDVIGTFAANGCKVLDLAPGVYQFTRASCTAIYEEIVSVPLI